MKLLLYVSKLYSIPIIQPLINYLDELKTIEYLIFVSKKVHFKLYHNNDFAVEHLTYSLKTAISFNPDFCLSPGNLIDFRLPGIKVGIFHGIGIEKKSHYKIRHIYDVYLTSGPLVTRKYEEFREKYKYFLVEETGWLKVDHILSFSNKNLKERLGFPLDKKIILYAPTFSNKLESGSDLLENIIQYIGKDELWVVKFHELMSKKIFNSLTESHNSALRIIDDYDITPYLHIADVMISDTSSVIYEFIILDKPVITYKTIDRKDKGIDISHPYELRDALDKTLNHPKENSLNRKKHIAEINPYLDCKTSERIVNVLDDILVKNRLPKTRKPLNLGRKLKIVFRDIKGKGL